MALMVSGCFSEAIATGIRLPEYPWEVDEVLSYWRDDGREIEELIREEVELDGEDGVETAEVMLYKEL
jgi:hypothetical protein